MYIVIHNQYLRLKSMRQNINFKWSLTGLNVEFSFSLPKYQTKVKEPSLPYYYKEPSLPYSLSLAGGKIVGFIPFPRLLTRCENANSPGLELGSPYPFPTMVTITSRAPTKVLLKNDNILCCFIAYSTILSVRILPTEKKPSINL